MIRKFLYAVKIAAIDGLRPPTMPPFYHLNFCKRKRPASCRASSCEFEIEASTQPHTCVIEQRYECIEERPPGGVPPSLYDSAHIAVERYVGRFPVQPTTPFVVIIVMDAASHIEQFGKWRLDISENTAITTTTSAHTSYTLQSIESLTSQPSLSVASTKASAFV